MFKAEVLRCWLTANERSGLWLARKTGLGTATVQRIIAGNGQPSLESVAAIARVTGLDPNDLISVGRENEHVNQPSDWSRDLPAPEQAPVAATAREEAAS